MAGAGLQQSLRHKKRIKNRYSVVPRPRSSKLLVLGPVAWSPALAPAVAAGRMVDAASSSIEAAPSAAPANPYEEDAEVVRRRRERRRKTIALAILLTGGYYGACPMGERRRGVAGRSRDRERNVRRRSHATLSLVPCPQGLPSCTIQIAQKRGARASSIRARIARRYARRVGMRRTRSTLRRSP